MTDKLDLYKLSGLNQFLNLDLEELFQDEFTLLCSYPLSKKELRFILENTTLGSDNAGELIFITLDDATEAILPIDLMRGGQEVKLEDLIHIEKTTNHYGRIYIRVSEIRLGEYVLKSGDKLIVEENGEIYQADVKVKRTPKKAQDNNQMSGGRLDVWG